MKPICLIPITTIGAFCGLSLFGIAPKAVSGTIVDVELAFLVDASNSYGTNAVSLATFNNIRNAHSSLFQESTFFDTYVKPLPNQKIAVSFWIYANSVATPVNWTLIDSQAAATSFGTAISLVTRTLPTNRTNLGQAIQSATNSINSNNYDGAFRIFDLASNGVNNQVASLPSPLTAATAALSLPGNKKVSAINSISTTQVLSSVLPSIIALSTNNNNPIGQHGFSLPDPKSLDPKLRYNLNFDPDPFDPTAPTSYAIGLREKIRRETCGTRCVATSEPSSLWALFGLSLVSLTSKLTQNKLIKQGSGDRSV